MHETREDAARAAGKPLHERVRPQDQCRQDELAIAQATIASQQRERDFQTPQAHAALRKAQQTRSIYSAEPRRSLSERQAQADLKRQQITQGFTSASPRNLSAPVAGTVQQLAMHTEAHALMIIVSDSASVSAEVALENKGIGFVSPGQGVAIKLGPLPSRATARSMPRWRRSRRTRSMTRSAGRSSRPR
ncbi:MAG: hypothetical protein ACO1PM_16870 [Acidovorax sp.]|jgi:hemolysin D